MHTINFSKVKITTKALEFLAEALKVNTTLHTLVINGMMLLCFLHGFSPFFSFCAFIFLFEGPIPSEGMLDVCKAIEENTTLKNLTMQQGPGKHFDSSIETAFKSRVCNNKSLLKINIGPLRSNDVRGALDALSKSNEKAGRSKVADDDEWAKLSFDYDEKDNYVYVYDPNYDVKGDVPKEIGSLSGK